jgi:hypothetical protein
MKRETECGKDTEKAWFARKKGTIKNENGEDRKNTVLNRQKDD